MDYKGTYYEVRRVPGTLSDRLMNEDDFGILPKTTSPGVLIIGDKVEPMTLEQVENRKKYFKRDIGWGQDADGRWTDGEGLKDVQLALASDVFKSLPLVHFDEIIHHAKLPRSIQEIRNLVSVQGYPYLVQLIGRSDNDRLITLKFGKDLTSLLMNFLPEGGKASFPEEWKYQWIVDIVLGLQTLHMRNIFHRDLTSNNVLYDEEHAILCDLESGPHTSHTIPPELVQEVCTEFNETMDIYAFGTLLWTIENRNMPRAHRNLKCTGVFAGLMSKCLSVEPQERPTIDEVIAELKELPQTASLFPGLDTLITADMTVV
ncbi:hypothetical protein I302_107091 [Kwoniella bestiolae CBS 10118]|uniref:TKL protein kinase n=1 Tax=Kwoniella bestiolae CBS 10118 TaxID=1296100 RepID=A0A1B9FZJ6_9TREE|nr:TKL protein kinase [Kwoniella bestiolae CBS 10118]OCF24185.1 TKL protein kinase [Kwoniella bestiolae CBS 10118]